jgi:hypothetical protein
LLFLLALGPSIYALPHANNGWAVAAWVVSAASVLLISGAQLLGLAERWNRRFVVGWIFVGAFAVSALLLTVGWMRDWR